MFKFILAMFLGFVLSVVTFVGIGYYDKYQDRVDAYYEEALKNQKQRVKEMCCD